MRSLTGTLAACEPGEAIMLRIVSALPHSPGSRDRGRLDTRKQILVAGYGQNAPPPTACCNLAWRASGCCEDPLPSECVAATDARSFRAFADPWRLRVRVEVGRG